MSRATRKIKSIQGERLELLIKENGINQKILASRIGYTEQYVSSWMYSDGLSEEIAKKIIEAYPIPKSYAEKYIDRVPIEFMRYSVDWLMGRAEYKNKAEELVNAIRKSLNKSKVESEAIKLLLESKGAILDAPSISYPVDSVDIEEPNVSVTYREETVKISALQYVALDNEILDFVEFKLTRLFNRAY